MDLTAVTLQETNYLNIRYTIWDNTKSRAGGLEGHVSKWKKWIFDRLAGCTEDRRAGRRAAEKSGAGSRKEQLSGLPFSAAKFHVQPASPP